MNRNKNIQSISSERAPRAIGPYSPAIQTGCFIYTSGQLGLDPATGNLVDGGIEAQTRQALMNIQALLDAAGCGMSGVIKTTVFLASMEDFTSMNAVYAEFFTGEAPARSTVAVAGLPKGGLVEIEAIARTESGRDAG
ncbi:MAG: RidA family protein [Chloroflexi bacterium]|nr:RidA family protein [Chloroflexota bacterium]